MSRVEAMRRQRGLRQRDLADRLGLSVQWVSNVESGWRPARHRREALAEALGVDVELLWPPHEDGAR